MRKSKDLSKDHHFQLSTFNVIVSDAQIRSCSHPDDVMHPPVKSCVTCCIPTFHTVALLLCSGTSQSLESRSCMMTFTNFTRNTLRHLLASARAVLWCPADTQLLRWSAAGTAVHVETFSCAGTPTDALFEWCKRRRWECERDAATLSFVCFFWTPLATLF